MKIFARGENSPQLFNIQYSLFIIHSTDSFVSSILHFFKIFSQTPLSTPPVSDIMDEALQCQKKGDAMSNNHWTEWNNAGEDELCEGLYLHEESALEAVSQRYGRLLRGLALRITGSPADAEECVNDALLDLWNAVPPDRPAHVLAHVSSLVRRRAVDRVRYKTAGCRGGQEYAGSVEELSECLADPQGASELDTLVIRDCLNRFLARLPEDDRAIFLLRYYRFLSNAEVADACGMRESAVVMRLVRIRKKLKKALENEGIYV
jgi:RNA polymerase sigma-70 factor (ECF subfamily)